MSILERIMRARALEPKLSVSRVGTISVSGGRASVRVEARGLGVLHCRNLRVWVIGLFRRTLRVPVGDSSLVVTFRSLGGPTLETRISVTPRHVVASSGLPQIVRTIADERHYSLLRQGRTAVSITTNVLARYHETRLRALALPQMRLRMLPVQPLRMPALDAQRLMTKRPRRKHGSGETRSY